MEQVYVLLFIAVFGNGEVNSHSSVYPSMELCEQRHNIIISQTPAVYAENDVVSLYAECLTMVTRKVNDQH